MEMKMKRSNYLIVVVPLAMLVGAGIKFGMGEKDDGAN
jgi:hypothetical protein